MKGKGGNVGNGSIPIEKKYLKSQVVGNASASSNPFVVLIPSDNHNSPVLEKGEVQHSKVQKEYGDVNLGSREHIEPVILETPSADAILQDLRNSPIGATPSPSYVEILKKKSVETSGSS